MKPINTTDVVLALGWHWAQWLDSRGTADWFILLDDG